MEGPLVARWYLNCDLNKSLIAIQWTMLYDLNTPWKADTLNSSWTHEGKEKGRHIEHWHKPMRVTIAAKVATLTRQHTDALAYAGRVNAVTSWPCAPQPIAILRDKTIQGHRSRDRYINRSTYSGGEAAESHDAKEQCVSTTSLPRSGNTEICLPEHPLWPTCAMAGSVDYIKSTRSPARDEGRLLHLEEVQVVQPWTPQQL